MPYSLATLRTLRKHLPASIPLIGCGGISSGTDALEYAKAGAALVQVYTAFGYDGVGTCRRIKDELIAALEKEGMTWREVVQKTAREQERENVVVAEREGLIGIGGVGAEETSGSTFAEEGT
jgi:dihydroorotate dehydrogenase